MEAWGKMASSVVPGLVFTVDYPKKHDNEKVPMLDFMVWKQRCASDQDENDDQGTSDKIDKNEKCKETVRYEFYEKPVANNLVMMRESAMPHKMMVASMVQEGVRRLANSHRSLEDKHKCKILGRYMAKLKMSGYSLGLRKEILTSAVQTQRKRELAHDIGVRPLHRPGGHGREATRRKKISSKSEWFSQTRSYMEGRDGRKGQGPGCQQSANKPTGCWGRA